MWSFIEARPILHFRRPCCRAMLPWSAVGTTMPKRVFAGITLLTILVFVARGALTGSRIAAATAEAAGRPCSSRNPCPPPPPPPPPPPGELASFFADANAQNLGSAVAFADLTGDGKADVIIGAEAGDNSADGGRGFVSVIDGSDLSTEVCRVTGTAPGEHLGARLAAGEVTIGSATVPIFVAGAWGVNNGSATQAGAVRAFAYDATATPKCQQLWENLGTGSTDFYGSSVAIGGGLVLAGAWGADLGGSETANIGYVRLLDGASGASLEQFNGANNLDEMGRGVAFGDVDHDGQLDLILGAGSSSGGGRVSHFGGYVRVISGADRTTQLWLVDAGLARATKPEPNFGYAVGSADVDGDGFDDLIVAAYRGKTGGTTGDATGYVRVFSGRTRLQLYQVNGLANGNEFGRAVWAADVNGDGTPDILVGEPGALNGSTSIPGYVRVFDGPTGTESFRFSGAAVGERFGYAVGAAVIDNGAGKANVAGGAYWGFNAATTWYAGSVRIFASPQ
jgi:FG-GAP repeat